MSAVMQAAPIAFPCENRDCRTKFAGSHCPLCKEPRSSYTALTKILAQPRLPDPLPACRYFSKALCACGGAGLCVDPV